VKHYENKEVEDFNKYEDIENIEKWFNDYLIKKLEKNIFHSLEFLQHIELFPYLKAYAKVSAETGIPIMRHMILLYPEDTIIQNGIPDNEAFQKFFGEKSGKRPYNEMFQYFLGNELLVAPIIDHGTTSRPVYLPEGNLYNFLTKDEYTGLWCT